MDVPERGSPETTMIGLFDTGFFPNPENNLFTRDNPGLSSVLQDLSAPPPQLEKAALCSIDQDVCQSPGMVYHGKRSFQNRADRGLQRSPRALRLSPCNDRLPSGQC